MEKHSYELSAHVYFLNQNNKKVDIVKTVPSEMRIKISNKLENIVTLIFKDAIKTICSKLKCKIIFSSSLNIYIHFMKPLSLKNMNKFIGYFHNDNTYLKLNYEKIYNNYNIVFDEFRYSTDKIISIARMNVQKFDNYWQWQN